MRIVAVADTHTFTSDLDVPDGDVFIHTGDICRGGDLEDAGDRKGALRLLTSALALHPYDPMLLQVASDYREKAGDHAGAAALRARLAEVTAPAR